MKSWLACLFCLALIATPAFSADNENDFHAINPGRIQRIQPGNAGSMDIPNHLDKRLAWIR